MFRATISARSSHLFMADWPYILCLVIGSVQQASSLKTPPVLSGGPLLLISCPRSMLDLPVNVKNSGMSSGASSWRVMPGRRVTDTIEGGAVARTLGALAYPCLYYTQKKEHDNFKLKSNVAWTRGGEVPKSIFFFFFLWATPHANRWFTVVIFSCFKAQATVSYCTYLIQVTSD